MANGLLKELQEVEPVALPERDVRAGKPLLGGLLKFDLARALARITTLAPLDLAGLFLGDLHGADRQDRHPPSGPDGRDVGPGVGVPPARRPRDAAAVRPLGALPRARPAPGPAARDRLALPDHASSCCSTRCSRASAFQSYYIFYASLFFALLYVSAFRWSFERVSGAILRAAGYRRARCSSARARTSRPSRTRCRTAARSSRTASSPARQSRSSTACATSARSSSSSATSTRSTRC